MTLQTVERELRLMIKTLTNLHYADWTSISDDEVRTGNPRVFCGFLRHIFDAHPRVLHSLLTSASPSSQNNNSQQNTQSYRCGQRQDHYNEFGPKPGQVQWSSISKHIATTIGFRAPPVSGAHCGAAAVSAVPPSFIVEEDDGRFMQRLLQYVLPEHFSLAPPMTPQQFFRASGGFVLAKTKLVRNVAALFARRETEIARRQEAQAAAAERARIAHDQQHSRVLQLNYAAGDDTATAGAYQSQALFDDNNPSHQQQQNQSQPRMLHNQYQKYSQNRDHSHLDQQHVTARQRAMMAEARAKQPLQQRLQELRNEKNQLNNVERSAPPFYQRSSNNHNNNKCISPSRSQQRGGGGMMLLRVGGPQSEAVVTRFIGGGIQTPPAVPPAAVLASSFVAAAAAVAGGGAAASSALNHHHHLASRMTRHGAEEELVEEPLLSVVHSAPPQNGVVEENL